MTTINLPTLVHFFLGLGEIRLQFIEERFKVLTTDMGHEEEGTENG
jgi:hypothetical protein